MPYVQRNQAGLIVSLSALPVGTEDQFMVPDDPEIIQFLSHPEIVGDERIKSEFELFAADLNMIRVVEDLIDLLTQKGVIMFSELPPPVQEKILGKKTTRQQFQNTCDILINDSTII